MRKVIDITITDEGRDKNKVFHIREMGAMQAEEWSIRALLALTKAGVDLGGIDPGVGMAAFAGSAFSALIGGGMSFADLKPLLDDMLTCVTLRLGASAYRQLLADDIEEVGTLFRLRTEVFKLHVDFSQPGSN